jgi:hypothetical protein
MPDLSACSIQERNSWCLRSRTIFRKAESQGIDGLDLQREAEQLISSGLFFPIEVFTLA